MLTGGSGSDWFLASLHRRTCRTLSTDLAALEIVTDIP